MRHTKSVSSHADTSCRGQYVALTLENVILNVPVRKKSLLKEERLNRPVTLVRALFCNLWKYRIGTDHDVKLIDTNGIQHSQMRFYSREEEVLVKVGDSRKRVVLASPEEAIEPSAKTRGWIWFPELGCSAFPRRLVFSFSIFDNDFLSGTVEDEEIIDFEFCPPYVPEIGGVLHLGE